MKCPISLGDNVSIYLVRLKHEIEADYHLCLNRTAVDLIVKNRLGKRFTGIFR